MNDGGHENDWGEEGGGENDDWLNKNDIQSDVGRNERVSQE